METFSASLAIRAGNSPVTGDFPAQRPVTRSFDVFFDLRLNILLSKQSWGWWFETKSRPLWRHCNRRLQSHVYVVAIYGLWCQTGISFHEIKIILLCLAIKNVNFCKVRCLIHNTMIYLATWYFSERKQMLSKMHILPCPHVVCANMCLF